MVVLGPKPRFSCMIAKCFTTEISHLRPWPPSFCAGSLRNLRQAHESFLTYFNMMESMPEFGVPDHVPRFYLLGNG